MPTIPATFPPATETPPVIKSMIEIMITSVLPHLFPENNAPDMINANTASIAKNIARRPPNAVIIGPNDGIPFMPDMPPIVEIAPIPIAPMRKMIPAISCKIARIVIPTGRDTCGGVTCSGTVDFPHFGQKLLPAVISAPQD